MSDSLGDSFVILNVWQENLEEVVFYIRNIVTDFPIISLDTEYPGSLLPRDDYSYNTLRQNVNGTKMIQLGLTFSDSNGEIPHYGMHDQPIVFQFNFADIKLNEDPHVPKSIQLLQDSGIDFSRNEAIGINAHNFAKLFRFSDAITNDSITWVSFHGAPDFAYIIKLLEDDNLPDSKFEFLALMRKYFRNYYDIKAILESNGVFGGLDKTARTYAVPRIGTSHLAGSDSLLTSRLFMKLQPGEFLSNPIEQYRGTLYGIGSLP